MPSSGYCLFDTPIGACAIAWRQESGSFAVTGLQLPDSSMEATAARIARNSGGQKTAPPPAIAALVGRIQSHLAGNLQDFRDVPVDLTGVGDFDRRVYEAAMRIPPGQTRTYGELANIVTASVQPPTSNLQPPVAVGQALARNPIPLIIPCHRVLAANGKLGGFSAPGALATKTRLLEIEGAKFPALLAFPRG